MSFKPCKKCGIVIEEDLAEVQAYKVHENDYGVRVYGFKCPCCKCVTITNDEDMIWFSHEELKESFGEYKQ